VPRLDMSDSEYEAQFLREGVASRIRRLRNMIDTIEREATAALETAGNGMGRYSSVPQIFVKELAWGLANVGVDQMLYTAANADVYAAEEKLKKAEVEN
jgi:hypothetical protein